MMIFTTLAGLVVSLNFAAFSSSSSYELRSYGVNSGGTNSASSSNYSLQAGTGEIAGSETGGPTYKIKSGSIETQQSNVPGAPTLSNGGGTYTNKINFIVNTSSNPSDTTYVVAVSTTSNFTVTNYVQADGTLGGGQVFQTYTQWGGASGTDAIGLSSGTTYYFKMAAMQGKFTATGFGPSANSTTATPALSFSLTPNTLNMGNLPPGSVIDSPSDISFTFSTNASFGGSIYMSGSNTGLVSATAGNYNITIAGASGNLSSLSEGFGLQGLTASSPLAIDVPYDGTSNTVGAIYTTFKPVFSSTSSVSTGTATARLKAKSSAATPAATDYTNTLTFIAAASY
jgi:hypothetical protein